MNVYHTAISGSAKPLVFMEHGFASGSWTPHNSAMAQAIQKAGCGTLEVDATNSNNNASGGRLEEFTLERHRVDLQDAFAWVAQKNKPWLTS